MPPVYEYRCGECSAVFAVLTSYERRDDAQTCANCGGRESRPVMSATPTTFAFADRSGDKRVRRGVSHERDEADRG